MVSFTLDIVKFLLIYKDLQNMYWFKRETRKNNLETLVKNIASIYGITFTDGDYMYRVAKDMFGFDYIERAKICKSIVGAYVQIGFSNLNDEILNDMVEQINKKVA